MAFNGIAVPSGMDLILVSQAASGDVALIAALMPLFGNRSMIEATPAQIAAAAVTAAVPKTHPIRVAASDPDTEAALEDAAQGGLAGTRKLLSNRNGRPVSGPDFAKAKARAERIGQEGEGLVNGYLAAQTASGAIASSIWASAANAVAPFDFETASPNDGRTLIDAKSTTGPFENVIHLSLAEIVEAAGEIPYRIYRVFELGDDGGKLRISGDIGPLARTLKALHEAHMPNGVRVDGFSVATAALTWGKEEYVARLDDEDAI